jgi:hypothetical protein
MAAYHMIVNVEHHVRCKDALAPATTGLELDSPCIEWWYDALQVLCIPQIWQ